MVLQIKADKQPIGNFEPPLSYTTHQVELQQGDSIYVFSDGYADQFGGEGQTTNRVGGKKFKTKNLKKLLVSLQRFSMKAQQAQLDAAFEAWKGDLEQIDDVCVIGVRV